MSTVVLFTKDKSNYYKFNVECYNKKRNATRYNGSDVVICHPPCPQWSQLRRFAKEDFEEKQLALWALELVRKNGGILEHPQNSTLFTKIISLKPGQLDIYGGQMLYVDLNWFGYPCKKKTGLYIVGLLPQNIPAYPISLNAITHRIGSRSRNRNLTKKELPKSRRDETPTLMCKWLLQVAEQIQLTR